MKQDRISELTKKAIEKPMLITQTLLEKTERVKNPSPRIDKIGRVIGTTFGVGLLLLGGAQLILGKTSWAIGTVAVGGITILSNKIAKLK